MATTEVWNDKAGQRQEKTEWHRVVLWGKTAESLSEYLTKGKQIYVEGRLQTRSYDDKDGKKVWTTEVVAEDVILLGGRGEGGGPDEMSQEPRSAPRARQASAPSAHSAHSAAPSHEGIGDDDVPF
jgi:single-strand DNA-binding protein